MKIFKTSLLWLTGILSATFVSGQQSWIQLGTGSKIETDIKLVSTDQNESVISFQLNAYQLKQVQTGNGLANIVLAPGSSRILKAGAPDLPCYATSVIINDMDEMAVTVVNSQFTEILNVEIAPSKGNLLRNVDPSAVPYSKGSEYQQDSFYPSAVSFLREPYILRDFRGQAVVIQPFEYNPVTKILRIYTNLTLKVKSTGMAGLNPFFRIKSLNSVDREYNDIYNRRFLNYNKSTKYTPVSDLPGKILIISDPSFMSTVQPLVDWKILEGIPCEMVSVATIGNTATAIKNYVTNYYNTNGLTFLLLVGDFAQVTSATANIGGVTGAKDIEYAFVSGSDHYPEFFVGRFSAETVADVQTQVQRSIYYEKTPQAGAWYSKNLGIASDQGPGDDNEYDWQHIRPIQADLLGFTYDTSVELFDGSQGGLDAAGNPTPADVTSAVNPGMGIITYCGHGADNAWGTTGFSNTEASALLNVNKLPFIYSVSCVIGHYNAGTCFCEAWMRASQTEGPAGAIGIFGSTINQSWNPPMEAEDEMIDILTETYTGNIKRTYAGIGENGCMKMNDTYADFDMTDTWTIFGDPSLMVRTKDPMSMTVSHQPVAVVGSSTFQVDCNVEGAYVAITYNNQILGTGYVSGGLADVTLNPAPATVGQVINVCVTAFNYVPYTGTFSTVNNNIPVDAQMANIIQPNGTYNCSGINIAPTVVIKNLGTDILTSATVNYQIDGGSVVSQSWTGNLATFSSDTVTFPSVALVSGSHSIRSFITNPNGGTDGYTANDEMIRTYVSNSVTISSDFTADITSSCNVPALVQFTNASTNASSYSWDFGDGTTSTDIDPSHSFAANGQYNVTLVAHAGICGDFTETKNAYILIGAQPPVVNDDYVCLNSDATLTASGSGVINWYTSGGAFVQTGTSMNVTNVTSDVTYYAENYVVSAAQYVGSVQSSTNGSMYTYPAERYLIFDCFVPCTLVSVEVNASTAGNRVIELRDASGATLQTATVNIPAGVSRITLNYTVPAGTNLRLVGPAAPNLWRNNSGVSYPYSIANLISINNTDAGTSVYYYFYNWEVKQPDCTSSFIPVTAYLSQPAVSISPVDVSAPGMTDGSATVNPAGNGPFTYLWSNGASSQTITGLAEGTYQVTVYDANGCQNTGSVNIMVTGINELNRFSELKIYPIPASDFLYINSDNSVISDVTVLDLLGNVIRVNKPNEKSVKLNITNLTSGIYTFNIELNGQVIKRKVTITK